MPSPHVNAVASLAASLARSARHTIVASVLAVLLCLATVWLRRWLGLSFGDRPLLILFMFPILLSALLGGAVPGLVATATAAAGTAFFVLPPQGRLSIAEGSDVMQWTMLIGCGLLASSISFALQRTRSAAALRLEQLVRAQASLRQVVVAIEQCSAGVLITDTAGSIDFVNRAFLRMTGYQHDELQGLNRRKPSSDSVTGLAYADMWATLDRGQTWTGRIDSRRKDGREYVVSVVASPVVDGDGRTTHFVSVQDDITDTLRIEAELALHRDHLEELVGRRAAQLDAVQASLGEQQRLFRTVADAVPGFVGYWDRDLRCRFANAAYLDWFGRTPEQMLDQPMQAVLGDALFDSNRATLEGVLRGERQAFMRTSQRPGDASPRYMMADYIPHQVDGSVVGFSVVVHDVTELKTAEIRLSTLNVELARRARPGGSGGRVPRAPSWPT